MKLSEITEPITFDVLGRDPELIRDIQTCLGVEPTSFFGPSTEHALVRFAAEQFMNNADTQLMDPSLAQALLTEGRGPKAESSSQEHLTSVEFETGLKFVLQWEGGYVNNPADKGSEMNKGITSQTYNAYREKKGLETQSVRLIKDWEVQDIYHSQYWTLAGCDFMPLKLAISCFDWQVNSGRGVTHLQEILGSKEDGIFGAQTKNTMQAYLRAHGEEKLLQEYLQKREAAYRLWAVSDQNPFLAGWLNRLEALKELLATL